MCRDRNVLGIFPGMPSQVMPSGCPHRRGGITLPPPSLCFGCLEGNSAQIMLWDGLSAVWPRTSWIAPVTWDGIWACWLWGYGRLSSRGLTQSLAPRSRCFGVESAVVAETFMLLLTLGTQAGMSGNSASLRCGLLLCCPGSGLELCGSSYHRPMREGARESLSSESGL